MNQKTRTFKLCCQCGNKEHSLKGKITVLNSLATSILVYSCTILETPYRVITEIDKTFFDFLWDGGNNKIAKNIIIIKIENGTWKW